jgi:hypothetical protein
MKNERKAYWEQCDVTNHLLEAYTHCGNTNKNQIVTRDQYGPQREGVVGVSPPITIIYGIEFKPNFNLQVSLV